MYKFAINKTYLNLFYQLIKNMKSNLNREPSTGVWNIRNAFTSVTVTPSGENGSTTPKNLLTSTARSAINLGGPTMNELQQLLGQFKKKIF